jgi:ribosomal protein S18 acetylase RimI-like enzyme
MPRGRLYAAPMRVRSIGWRTDLALRQLEGAEIHAHEHHLVVRTAANPTYRWANFLLFDAPPRAGDAERWIELFEREFPSAGYLAFGVESPAGELGELAGLTVAGVTATTDTVLSAGELRAPARDAPAAALRELRGDADWRQLLALRLAMGEQAHEPAFEEFVERQLQTQRGVCERGHGAWFGAFDGDRLCSSLGIFDAGAGMARFQNVDTHPAHRRRGLARALLLAAGAYARARLGAHTLVIAADPDYFAIELYRALGFRERERHVQLERVGANA